MPKREDEWYFERSDVPSWDEEYEAHKWRGRFAICMILAAIVTVCAVLAGLMQ